jgi:hypothetical protein
MDEDLGPDDLLGTTYTNNQGDFSISVYGNDWVGTPDIYLIISTQSNSSTAFPVQVKQTTVNSNGRDLDLHDMYTYTTGTVADVGPSTSFGVIDVASNDDAGSTETIMTSPTNAGFAVFDAMYSAATYASTMAINSNTIFTNRTATAFIGSSSVLSYSYTNNESNRIFIRGSQAYSYDTVAHEYGHWLLIAAGIRQTGMSHQLDQNLRYHTVGAETAASALAAAFSEGWADYFAVASQSDTGSVPPAIATASGANYVKTYISVSGGVYQNYSVNLANGALDTANPSYGEDNEVSVARILYGVDQANAASGALVWNTVGNSTVHDLSDFWNLLYLNSVTYNTDAFQNNSQRLQYGRILEDNNVAPTDLDVSGNGTYSANSPPPTFSFEMPTFGPDGGKGLAFNQFRVQFFNSSNEQIYYWSVPGQDFQVNGGFAAAGQISVTWTPTPDQWDKITSLATGTVYWNVSVRNNTFKGLPTVMTGYYWSGAQTITVEPPLQVGSVGVTQDQVAAEPVTIPPGASQGVTVQYQFTSGSAVFGADFSVTNSSGAAMPQSGTMLVPADTDLTSPDEFDFEIDATDEDSASDKTATLAVWLPGETQPDSIGTITILGSQDSSGGGSGGSGTGGDGDGGSGSGGGSPGSPAIIVTGQMDTYSLWQADVGVTVVDSTTGEPFAPDTLPAMELTFTIAGIASGTIDIPAGSSVGAVSDSGTWTYWDPLKMTAPGVFAMSISSPLPFYNADSYSFVVSDMYYGNGEYQGLVTPEYADGGTGGDGSGSGSGGSGSGDGDSGNDPNNPGTIFTITAAPSSTQYNQTPGAFVITRSGGNIDEPATATPDIEGAPSSDYTFDRSFTFPPDVLSITVHVTATKASTLEDKPSETVDLAIDNGDDGSGDNTSQATVTINIPAKPQISIAADEDEISEQWGSTVLIATRDTDDLSESLTLPYEVGGDAVNGQDYFYLFGDVTFLADPRALQPQPSMSYALAA